MVVQSPGILPDVGHEIHEFLGMTSASLPRFLGPLARGNSMGYDGDRRPRPWIDGYQYVLAFEGAGPVPLFLARLEEC